MVAQALECTTIAGARHRGPNHAGVAALFRRTQWCRPSPPSSTIRFGNSPTSILMITVLDPVGTTVDLRIHPDVDLLADRATPVRVVREALNRVEQAT